MAVVTEVIQWDDQKNARRDGTPEMEYSILNKAQIWIKSPSECQWICKSQFRRF